MKFNINDIIQDWWQKWIKDMNRNLQINGLNIVMPFNINKLDFVTFENKYLSQYQYKILQDIENNKYDRIIFSGAIGSGKTFLACYVLIKNLIIHKDSYTDDTNNFIVGNSIDSITTNTLKQIKKICSLLNISFIDKRSNNTVCMINGIPLKIYGGKNKDAFYKIRGANSALVYVNEATLMHKDTLTEVLKRLRVGQQTIIFDTNPDHPYHFFKKDYIDNTKLYKTYNFTIYDNPLLSKEFIQKQELIGSYNITYKQRVLMGEWVSNETSMFTKINIANDNEFEFVSPIMYIDPAFSIGGDNTAVCLMESHNDKFYSLIFQCKKPVIDMSILTTIAKLIESFNPYVIYIEDRDSVYTKSSIIRSFENLRVNLNKNFALKAVKPKVSKYDRILNLIVPFAINKLLILKESTPSVFNDIYLYRGLSNDKINDDALDAIAGAYLFLTLNGVAIKRYFSISKYVSY